MGLFDVEVAKHVTVGRDRRLWINGKFFPFLLARSGPVVVAGDQPGTKVLLLPVLMVEDEAIISDLSQGVDDRG